MTAHSTHKTLDQMKALAIEAELYSHNLSRYTMHLRPGTLEKVFADASKVMRIGREWGMDYTAMGWKRFALKGAYQALCATPKADRPKALVRKFIKWRDEMGERPEKYEL